MKKVTIVLTILFIISLFSVVAQEKEELKELINFDITLEDLSAASGDMEILAQMAEKLIVIRGTVGSRKVLDADKDNYLAELELISGEWVGLEEVRMYSAFVLLVGPEFANSVPARRSRNPHPDEVPVNSEVLTICRLVGINDETGVVIPVLEAYEIRVLD